MTSAELEKCITEYGTDIFSFCKSLTLNVMEAEELYQDTFLKATELKLTMDAQDNVKSFLISIALRLWKNKKRKHAWRRRIAQVQSLNDACDVGIEAAGDDVEEVLLQEEERRLVQEAVGRLPEKLRIVTLLYYMEELSVNEIAVIVKIPRGTVLSRLHKARECLRMELEDVFDGF